MSEQRVAVIVDLVGSKRMADRREVQAAVVEAFATADETSGAVEALAPSVGDEFQGIYPTLSAALEVTLRARLALPEGVDCRFGLGIGEVVAVGTGRSAVIQDGSAWWLARRAIDEAHKRESARTPTLRSWFCAGEEERALEAVVNAYLLSRDHVLGTMTARARRITLGTMQGQLQAELAESEGITQSAVSQALRRSGGAILLAAIEEIKDLAL